MQRRDGQLTLCDVYEAWKSGKSHLLQGNEFKLLISELEAYRTSGTHAASTAGIAKRWRATFQKKQFMSESSTIADLPQIVQKAQTHYALTKKYEMFNIGRNYFLGFVRTHCKHSPQSAPYQSIQRVELLQIARRTPHRPLESPRDVDALIAKINSNTRITDVKKRMLAFHPFRPTEFFQLKWERDKQTGHLRIKGTNTAQSVRVIPMLLYPTQYKASKLGSYRLTDKALNNAIEPTGILSRSRDFRRSWAIWAEKAHIPRSHIIAYTGHKGRQMTDLYQARAIIRRS